jgi:hypothetical protein
MPQAIIDFTKRIEPGSWRYIGQRLEDIELSQIPIAGTERREIHCRLGGQICAVGGAGVANAFVIERPPLRLLYVRPGYTGYRRLALNSGAARYATAPGFLLLAHRTLMSSARTGS